MLATALVRPTFATRSVRESTWPQVRRPLQLQLNTRGPPLALHLQLRAVVSGAVATAAVGLQSCVGRVCLVRLAQLILLGVAFSSNIGGMLSPVASPQVRESVGPVHWTYRMADRWRGQSVVETRTEHC